MIIKHILMYLVKPSISCYKKSKINEPKLISILRSQIIQWELFITTSEGSLTYILTYLFFSLKIQVEGYFATF